jgi:hypothetical protein
VLYELMCGRLPHDLRDKSIPEAARVIREEDPTPLSSIDRSLRGDLETIVAKTLEKEKERRYQSPAALAADIRHYLADEPIVARPASTFYHLRKFARRNKTLVGGVAASFALLLAGTAGIAWQWQAARSEAARATEINDYLMHMFALVNPMEGMNPLETPQPGRRLPSVDELIDEAAQRLDHDLTDWPDVQSELHLRLGHTYWGLGRFKDARHHISRAYDIRAKALGEEHVDTLMALVWRGVCAIQTGGSISAAERDLQRAVHGLQQRPGRFDSRTLMAEMWLAGAAWQLHGPVEAEKQFRQLQNACHEALGADDRLTLFVEANLGFFLNAGQRHAEAEVILSDVLERARRTLSEDDALLRAIAGQQGNALTGLNSGSRSRHVGVSLVDTHLRCGRS